MKQFFKKLSIIHYPLLIIFSSCSVSHQLSKSADKILLKDSVISTGHIGISIYEPATNTYWYNYNATKYFVPASNTKLFTLYAGMKYLGDSLVGLKYYKEYNQLNVIPTADPTFLNSEYKQQPVFNFLVHCNSSLINLLLIDSFWKEKSYGNGWQWNDYEESFATQRSAFPIYGNIVQFKTDSSSFSLINKNDSLPIISIPKYFTKFVKPDGGEARPISYKNFKITRSLDENNFLIKESKNPTSKIKKTPFNTDAFTIENLLYDTFIKVTHKTIFVTSGPYDIKKIKPIHLVYSQPTDSLLKPMMHRSDNFFAEQTLLMVSNEHLGYMNDEDIIDTLLKTDLKDVPQKPKWVDGCGLSRYNLFTPQSFVYILNKMKNEFGLERLKVILPTGGEGTLKNYYLNDSSFIYAKSGSLSNNAALSGFLITKKNKLIIFSILVNNFQGDASAVRLAIEKFIDAIRETY